MPTPPARSQPKKNKLKPISRGVHPSASILPITTTTIGRQQPVSTRHSRSGKKGHHTRLPTSESVMRRNFPINMGVAQSMLQMGQSTACSMPTDTLMAANEFSSSKFSHKSYGNMDSLSMVGESQSRDESTSRSPMSTISSDTSGSQIADTSQVSVKSMPKPSDDDNGAPNFWVRSSSEQLLHQPTTEDCAQGLFTPYVADMSTYVPVLPYAGTVHNPYEWEWGTLSQRNPWITNRSPMQTPQETSLQQIGYLPHMSEYTQINYGVGSLHQGFDLHHSHVGVSVLPEAQLTNVLSNSTTSTNPYLSSDQTDFDNGGHPTLERAQCESSHLDTLWDTNPPTNYIQHCQMEQGSCGTGVMVRDALTPGIETPVFMSQQGDPPLLVKDALDMIEAGIRLRGDQIRDVLLQRTEHSGAGRQREREKICKSRTDDRKAAP